MAAQRDNPRIPGYLAAVAGLGITLAVIRFPQEAFEASLEGLKLWFEVVLPALLPFFAMSEILMGIGLIHAVGVFLEPLMRPVFRIPGVGGFAVAMGLASGYPLGAKISGSIRRQGLCTQEEGERLIAFANTADPLFMVGAVAVGMFALPRVGVTLAIAHYLAVILVGFIMRYHAGGKVGEAPEKGGGTILRRALQAMLDARKKDGRPFGELFSDAVKESMQSMLFIGGCIMMFSVFIRILDVAGFVRLLEAPLSLFSALFGIDPDLVPSLVKGAFEITLGTQDAAGTDAPLLQRVAIASLIIGWSGFSVHAQVSAMTFGTDIRIGPYLFARLLHGILAAGLTVALFGPLEGLAANVETMFLAEAATGGIAFGWAAYWAMIAGAALLIIFGLGALSLALAAMRGVRLVVFRVKGR